MSHFFMENSSGNVRDVDVFIRVFPLENDIQFYCLLSQTSEREEYIVLNEEFAVINRPKCLFELVRDTGLKYS